VGLASRTVEDIADEFINEIRDGVGDSGIRPGIMGEIGTSDPLTPAEARVLRAHAWAHLETDVPLTIHQAPWARGGHQILDVLESEGVDLGRVVLGHMMVIEDMAYQRSLLERGVVLSYDFLGSDHAIFTYGIDVPPGRYPPNDYDVIRVVADLVADGFGGQILLSGDIGERIRLRSYGSWGYSHILVHVLPLMQALSIDEASIQQIIVENPRRLLSIAKSSARADQTRTREPRPPGEDSGRGGG
jgi:phosphotriesterase-related protein